MSSGIQVHSEHLLAQLPSSYEAYKTLLEATEHVPVDQASFARTFDDTLDRWQEVGGAIDYIQYQRVGSFVLTATPTIEVPGSKLVSATADRLGLHAMDCMVEPLFTSYLPAREDSADPFLAGAFAESTWAEQQGYSPKQLMATGEPGSIRFSLIDSQPDPTFQGLALAEQANLITERAANAPTAGHHSPRPLETAAYWLNLANSNMPLSSETTSVPHLDMESMVPGQTPFSVIKDDWAGPELQMMHVPNNSSHINRLALQ